MRRVAVAVALLTSTGCREYIADPNPDPDGHVPVFSVGGAVWARGDVDLPDGPLEVAAMRVDLRRDQGPRLQGVWRCTEALGDLREGDAPFELELPRLPAKTEMYAPDDDAGDFRIASYLVGVYVDRNEDHEPGPGEPLVAGSLQLLIYADGSRPLGSEGLSLHMGWSRVSWLADDLPYEVQDIGFFGNLRDHDIEANLLPSRREPGLEGVVRPSFGAGRVDLYSTSARHTGVTLPGSTLQSVEVDASAADAPFRFDGLGAPPPEHLFASEGLGGARIAEAVAVAYEDVDGSGTFDPDVDVSHGTSLDADGQPRMLTYLEPTDFTAAFNEQIYGQASGWVLSEGERPVDWGLGLVVDREK